MASSPTFTPVVCHVTTNSPDGKSSFLEVSPLPSMETNPGIHMTYIYSAPANFSIAKDEDLSYHQSAPSSPPLRSFPAAGGLSTVMMHIPPNPEGNPGFMHKTQTLDHVVILEGELELTLDGGETKLVKAGEVVVQRACMHSWKNPSKTKGARMFAIAVGTVGAVEGAMQFAGQ